jgi:amino-acid N-acetyltransferase
MLSSPGDRVSHGAHPPGQRITIKQFNKLESNFVTTTQPDQSFVQQFRDSAPYINAFRGRTFVIMFYGEALDSKQLPTLVHDFALLHSLGVRLVLVHGARPQIERRMRQLGHSPQYHNNLRVTDTTALQCMKEAVGSMRMELEAMLSMGLANSPMAGARLRVASGNFVTARPYGVHDGVDFLHTGEVRRIDTRAINRQLEDGAIVLLSPSGYSPTGEIFNLSAEDVTTACAAALGADKLIYLMEHKPLKDARKQLIRELSVEQADALLKGRRKLPDDVRRILRSAVQVCVRGVRRVHLLQRSIDGALLQELFTRDGIGTLVSADIYEGVRNATIEDVAGILELIGPLEQEGSLVRRSRELLEMEIKNFIVIERDGMIIACAALYPFIESHAAELACLAVHPQYRGHGRGNALLEHIEGKVKQLGVTQLFVLSTRTMHWFQERGFAKADIKDLPVKRKAMYNYQRQSKVFIKAL